MKALLCSFALASLTFATAIVVVAAEPPKNLPPENPPPEDAVFFVEGSGVLRTDEDQNRLEAWHDSHPTIEKLRERLQDPEQRMQLRAERREGIAQRYRDIREVLGLDHATEQRLIDLLTDQELEHLADNFLNSGEGFGIQDRADAVTRELRALRDLLGDERFERYQEYTATLSERAEVNRFDARLGPADKLHPGQKTQLIGLFAEQNRMLFDREPGAGFGSGSLLAPNTSPQARQRQSLLLTIATNEDMWRKKKAMAPQLRKNAAEFLTAPQLQMFETILVEDADKNRTWIEQARVRAGLSPTIPEHSDIPLPARPARTPLAGTVTLEFTVTVNRNQPRTTTHTVANGGSFIVDAGDALWIEAVPTLFDDHWLTVGLKYYEEQPDGSRRPLNDGRDSIGIATRLPDGTPNGGGGGGGMVTGNKAYAVTTLVKLLPG